MKTQLAYHVFVGVAAFVAALAFIYIWTADMPDNVRVVLFLYGVGQLGSPLCGMLWEAWKVLALIREAEELENGVAHTRINRG